MAEETDTQKGFKVHDKRRFTDEGEAREQQPAGEPASSEEQPPTGAGAETRAVPVGDPGDRRDELPSIDFSTFIISLSTQALMHLGEMGDPVTGKVEKDVAVAKQTIDIIGMLSEKSRGNLDEAEEQLVKEVLYNLRMRYVEAVRTP